MSPVVNADTPVPISNVIQAKSLMYSRSLDGQKHDWPSVLNALIVVLLGLLCFGVVFGPVRMHLALH